MIIFSEIAEIMKNVNLKSGADLKLLEKQTEEIEKKEQYIITITNLLTEEEQNKYFSMMFRKQKPNLVKMKIRKVKLFSHSFKLFS